MVNIKYVGHMKDCNVKAGSAIFRGWKKNEIKNTSKEIAVFLLKNKDFKLVGSKPIKKEKKVIETPKKEIEIDFDLNDDGVVDSRDVSLAGKVLASARKIKQKEEDN